MTRTDMTEMMGREVTARHGVRERRWTKIAGLAVAGVCALSLGAAAMSRFTENTPDAALEMDAARAALTQLGAPSDAAGRSEARSLLLVLQALEAIEHQPDQFSSAEFARVGMALSAAGLGDKANEMLAAALVRAATAEDFATANRLLGERAYRFGRLEEGDLRFEAALEASLRFPTGSDLAAARLEAVTLIDWAAVAAAVNERWLAEEKAVEARLLVATLPDGPDVAALTNRIAQVEVAAARIADDLDD